MIESKRLNGGERGIRTPYNTSAGCVYFHLAQYVASSVRYCTVNIPQMPHGFPVPKSSEIAPQMRHLRCMLAAGDSSQHEQADLPPRGCLSHCSYGNGGCLRSPRQNNHSRNPVHSSGRSALSYLRVATRPSDRQIGGLL